MAYLNYSRYLEVYIYINFTSRTVQFMQVKVRLKYFATKVS